MIGSAGSGGLTNTNSNLIISDINAGLGTLANNGGPTQTIALSSTSPAMGAGSTTITGVSVPTTDQRGGTRPTTSIDIGAYQGGVSIPAISFKPYATYGTPLTASAKVATKTTVTTPVVVTTTVATPVTVTPPVVKAATKAKTKVKLKVVTKKTHPGGGSSTKFHKTTTTKTVKHLAVAKAHPAAHAKKK